MQRTATRGPQRSAAVATAGLRRSVLTPFPTRSQNAGKHPLGRAELHMAGRGQPGKPFEPLPNSHGSKAARSSRERMREASQGTHHGRALPVQVADRTAFLAYARAQSQRWGFRHWVFAGAMLGVLGSGMVVIVKQAFHTDSQRLKDRKEVLIIGSGFAALSCAAEIDTNKYNVTVVSPRNHFLFTPVLPQVALGTMDASGAVEPIRKFLSRHGQSDVEFLEAKCKAVDVEGKRVTLKPASGGDFEKSYDKLVLAHGAHPHDEIVKGACEHALYLRDLQDARRLRSRMLDCLETASLPTVSEEEKKRLCSLVVVGGGPVSVNVAVELHKLLETDLKKLFPALHEYIALTFVDVGDHAKNIYDAKVSNFFTEGAFSDCHHVSKVKSKVLSVNERSIILEHGVPVDYGVLVWATQPAATPLTRHIREKNPKEQRNDFALVTDPYLTVKGIGDGDIYAIGECSTIEQTHITAQLEKLFSELDENGDGSIDMAEFQNGMKAKMYAFPQLQQYAEHTQQLFEEHDENKDGVLDEHEFADLLKTVDASLTGMPTSAQTAQQEGAYVALSLNNSLTEKQVRRLFHSLDTDGSQTLDAAEVAAGTARLGLPSSAKAVREFMDALDDDKSGAIDEDEFVKYVLASQTSGASSGDWKRLSRHKILPFRYQHLGGFEYVGYDQHLTERGSAGRNILDGYGAWWLWRSVFATHLLSAQNRAKLLFNFVQNTLFGREFTRT